MSAPRHRLRTVLLLLAAGTSAWAGGNAEREVVDLARVRASTSAEASTVLERRLEDLHGRGDVPGLVALVRGEVLAQGDSIAREWLLDRAMHLLATLPEGTGARALCVEISARTPRIFVRSDPDHSAAVPLYDPAATARFVLRRWAQRASYDRTVAALRMGDLSPLARFSESTVPAERDPAKAGVLDAFTAASEADLRAYRTPLIDAASRGENVDELLDAFARRLHDEELFAILFQRAQPAVALRAVSVAGSAFAAPTSLGLLKIAGGREELASAALLEIGRIAATDGAARRVLLDSLGDPHRAPSAAAALAELHDAAVTVEIESRLKAERSETASRHLVLALQLDGSDAARAALDRYLATGAGSPHLRKEIRQWLAR